MTKQKNTIIAITGKTGAGKSTLATALAKDLNATLIAWDDFDEISKIPSDLINWYESGQDYGTWDYKTLANVLLALRSQKSEIHPIFHTELKATKFIIFDAPLGKLHKQTGQYIDICVHIEVPLDISLVRRTLRDFKVPEKTKEELLEDLEFYINHSRPLFFDDDLKKIADLIIDGMLPIEKQVQDIKRYLNKHKLE